MTTIRFTLLAAAGLLLSVQSAQAQLSAQAEMETVALAAAAPDGRAAAAEVETAEDDRQSVTDAGRLSKNFYLTSNQQRLSSGYGSGSPMLAALPLQWGLLGADPVAPAHADWFTSQFNLLNEVHTVYMDMTSVETPDLSLRLDPMNLRWSLQIKLGGADSLSIQ